RLALRVDLAHVDRALEAEELRGGRGGDAVLAGARLGDDARLADAARQERLPEHVVDLVAAGVVEVLALEEDARPAGVLGEAGHLGDDRGAPRVAAVQLVELGAEGGIRLRVLVGRGELVDRGDERLGHEAPAVVAEEGPGESAQALADARAHPAARNDSSVVTGSSPVTRRSPMSTTSAPASR